MTRVVEYLAELTGFRDREALDVMLVNALRDIVQPTTLGIYRVVGEAGQERWLTRARIGPNETTATADPLWTEFETLPALQAQPERAACLRESRVIESRDRPLIVFFPLTTERETAGVLEIETAEPLDEDHRRTVWSILRIYRNFQSLLDYSERDTLTGLLNRKTFDESFLRMALELAGGTPMGTGGRRREEGASHAFLGVIDIDHFKRVNDTHGHLIGDEVLMLLARQMRSCFRFYDSLFRFGGEEFVVLVRCEQSADAARAFERLRSTVQGFDFPRAGQVTVSVGITAVRAGDTPSGAFERADKAIYWAKQNGRNRVAEHEALVAQGLIVDSSRESDVELF